MPDSWPSSASWQGSATAAPSNVTSRRSASLIAFDGSEVTFRYKDYRRSGVDRQQVMTLAANEFIRRFLIHVLPRGFHRIRHYGLLASSARKDCLAQARELLKVAPTPDEPAAQEPADQEPADHHARAVVPPW